MVLHAAVRFGYDGQTFTSYARDPSHPGSIEEHLVAGLMQEGLTEGTFVTGSRTDARVSAVGNVCRVTLDRPHLRGLPQALLPHLPEDLWVTGAAPVAPDWNPRHATRRHYVYWHPVAGELPLAKQACRLFLGRHDFRAFCRHEPGRSPMRSVARFDVEETQGLWRFDVEGPSFLWNQVRRMVGAAVAVARGQATGADIGAALAAHVLHPCFENVPPEGLVLWEVRYPGMEWEAPRPWRTFERRRVAAHSRWQVADAVRRGLSGSA